MTQGRSGGASVAQKRSLLASQLTAFIPEIHFTDEGNEIFCSRGRVYPVRVEVGFELGSGSKAGLWLLEREPCIGLFPEAVGMTFPWGSPSISTCGARKVGGGPSEQCLPMDSRGGCQAGCLNITLIMKCAWSSEYLSHTLTGSMPELEALSS